MKILVVFVVKPWLIIYYISKATNLHRLFTNIFYVIHMQSWKQCTIPVVITMGSWQLMHLGNHVPKYMSCQKRIVVITRTVHWFQDCIYIPPILLFLRFEHFLWVVDHLWLLMSTSTVIDWFKKIENKKSSRFIKLNIVDFYPCISEQLLDNAVTFAKLHTTINDQEIRILKHSPKALLFDSKDIWIKTVKTQCLTLRWEV